MEGARPPHDPEVPLGDAAIATEIAQAAARGRGADRAPTLEQLLAAFGESAPTDAARRRVSAALRVAGMGVRPDVLTADPGQRLLLLPPGTSAGRSRGRGLLGLVGVAAVLIAAAAGASLLDRGGKPQTADSLPEGTTPSSVVPPSTSAPATTPAVTDTTPAETDTTATDTTATSTTPSDADAEAAAAARARRQRAARARRRREQEAAAAAAARQRRAAASRQVTVRVDATGRPTFLCVDDGKGNDLFSGTLSGKKVFRGRRIRMNIGLASTVITVNGNPVRLNGSPDGLDITRAGGAKTLPLGQRPCG
ncbi:hypothetical protein [Conexibacter woesei]|uniref:hypothetical protein n=1 Tax=Conexibacter woesei TaxID=191495 RepID=UPI0012DD7070|nr:hypothetical protein [Conexibacter woesei]